MNESELLTLYLMSRAAVVGAIISVLFSLLVCGPEWLRKRDDLLFLRSVGYLCACGVPVAVIGFVAGYLTATSRAGAIGNLIPALFAALAGLHIYVFGKENQHRVIVSFMAIVVTGMTFYGVQYGAYRRDIGREARLHDAVRLELKIQNIRENLGLKESLPAWALGVEGK
jgi:hypothetical protein